MQSEWGWDPRQDHTSWHASFKAPITFPLNIGPPSLVVTPEMAHRVHCRYMPPPDPITFCDWDDVRRFTGAELSSRGRIAVLRGFSMHQWLREGEHLESIPLADRDLAFTITIYHGELGTPVAPVLAFPNRAAIDARRTRGVWPGTYAEYTRHPEFRRIAALAKKEWGYQCLLNVNHRGPVEMHHRTYAGVPFGETWRDLIPLCEDCHGLHHHRLPKPDRGLFDEVIERPQRKKAA